VANGVAPEIITVEGRGEDVLIVPTGPTVREPQNRRVRIELQQPAGWQPQPGGRGPSGPR
jgi:outer membrane protein OmpA-like peptidoglycan-associated protein